MSIRSCLSTVMPKTDQTTYGYKCNRYILVEFNAISKQFKSCRNVSSVLFKLQKNAIP